MKQAEIKQIQVVKVRFKGELLQFERWKEGVICKSINLAVKPCGDTVAHEHGPVSTAALAFCGAIEAIKGGHDYYMDAEAFEMVEMVEREFDRRDRFEPGAWPFLI